MSDIVERAKAALEDTGCSDDMMDFFRVGLVRELVAELDRLHTWDGLMSLVDEHYPTDIFPHFAGASDNPDRDPGPRILSLLREVDRLRKITDIIDPDSVYREQRDRARSALRAAADEGDQPLGEKPAATRDDLTRTGAMVTAIECHRWDGDDA